MTRKGILEFKYFPYYTYYKKCPFCKKIFHFKEARTIIKGTMMIQVCPYCSCENYEHLSLQEIKVINNRNPSQRKVFEEKCISQNK